MFGGAIINVGKPKAGKSTMTHRIIKKYGAQAKYIYIYDVNKEYSYVYKPAFMDFKPYMAMLDSYQKDGKLVNSLIVFEEATMFFSNRGCNEILTNMLVRRRHTNNLYVLNFHSFRTIPRYVFDLVNYINVFKTNDTEKKLREKCDHEVLIDSFINVQNSFDEHACICVKML